MPSQDDDSEEVSINSLHDVMALMTRRFVELLVKQDECQAKQFAELFDVSFKKIGHSAQSDDVVIDLTEQTVSLREKTSARTSGWMEESNASNVKCLHAQRLVIWRRRFQQLYRRQRAEHSNDNKVRHWRRR